MINNIKNIRYTESNNFFLIAGPCVIENENLTSEIAESILSITDKLKIPFIFKASYRKANRSKSTSFSGIGDSEALNILETIRKKLNIPVLTDIHLPEEAQAAGKIADVLQIPAFLSRQTDLLVAAGKTGKHVNIKKGQFLSAQSMKFAAEKVSSTGNNNIILTERGTTFGYNDLVVDFRGIHTMKQTGYPVVLDVTHSLQQPNLESGVTGGQPEMIEIIAKSGIAAGCDGLFIETHPDPLKSPSDGANMLKLSELEKLLGKLVLIRKAFLEAENI